MIYFKVIAFEPTSIINKRMDFFYLQDDLELNRGDGFAFVLFNKDGVLGTTVRLNGVLFANLKQIEFVALNSYWHGRKSKKDII